MLHSLYPRSSCVLIAILLLTGLTVIGQEPNPQQGVVFDEVFEMWPVDLKINGQIMLAGSEQLPEGTLEHFLKMVQRRSDQDPSKVVHVQLANPESDLEWPENVEVNRVTLTNEQDLDLAEVSGIWLTPGRQLTKQDVQQLNRLSDPLHAFIGRGGILLADQWVSPWLGQWNFRTGERLPMIEDGLNLVPDCVIGCGFQSEDEKQMLSVLSVSPRSIGIGVPAGGLVVLNGRKMRAYGERPATFLMAANIEKPIRRKELRVSGLGQRRINPYLQMVDLTAWRRHAIDRTVDPFPPAEPPAPYVENGRLVIVGGGGMPEGLLDQFIEMAGGENAKLVYIPCAEQDDVPPNSRLLQGWRDKGVASAVMLHTKDRSRANSDETFLAPLVDATGIWLGGGRQWNFSDSYYGTEAHRLMKQVVQRGGVIGGSSAGASIQARYLARANPLGNFDIMVDGYERGGLGFIGGVAIDQHFSQRRRQPDMTSLVNRFPQLLGIGLDEKTAIVVRGSTAEVVGDGRVFFYDRNQPVIPGQPDYVALEDGDRYDLSLRERIAPEDSVEAEDD